MMHVCRRLADEVKPERFRGLDFGLACEIADACADNSELAYRGQADGDRQAYLAALVKAVDGDLDATYGQARGALAGIDQAGER